MKFDDLWNEKIPELSMDFSLTQMNKIHDVCKEAFREGGMTIIAKSGKELNSFRDHLHKLSKEIEKWPEYKKASL